MLATWLLECLRRLGDRGCNSGVTVSQYDRAEPTHEVEVFTAIDVYEVSAPRLLEEQRHGALGPPERGSDTTGDRPASALIESTRTCEARRLRGSRLLEHPLYPRGLSDLHRPRAEH